MGLHGEFHTSFCAVHCRVRSHRLVGEKMHFCLLAAVWLVGQLASPALSLNGHVVEVHARTTLVSVYRRAPFANSSSSSAPLPSWNPSAAFTFTPVNPINASAPAQNSTSQSSKGGLGGILDPITSGLLGPITSGLLGPITSGVLGGATSGLNASGIASGLPNVTNSLSLSRPTISSLSLSLLSSSVRWPNSSSVAAPTSRTNATSTRG